MKVEIYSKDVVFCHPDFRLNKRDSINIEIDKIPANMKDLIERGRIELLLDGVRIPSNHPKVKYVDILGNPIGVEKPEEKPALKEKPADLTLDEKDVENFLNQNTRTVAKNIKEQDLSEADLKTLWEAEESGKNRGRIIKSIKAKLEDFKEPEKKNPKIIHEKESEEE